MSPRVFALPYAVVFWVVFLLVFLVMEGKKLLGLRRQMKRTDRSQDAGSVKVVAFANQVGTIGAFALPAFFAGIALMIAGALLRRHCFSMLGPSFTLVVAVRPDQEVVERGAYRYVRHPSYTAALLIFAGVGLCLTNWLSFTLLAGVSAVAYAYRAAVEERALTATLGEAYRSYRARTKRFIPFVV